jgi:hypothetical protein
MRNEYNNMARYANVENEKRQHLQEQIETLAKQHSRLEQETLTKLKNVLNEGQICEYLTL